MAPYSALPEPMLDRSGRLPAGGDFAYEVKWDGFRAILTTEGRVRVLSRRGWDMTSLVPEFAALPVYATLDGELCAFSSDGAPDFPLVCERMLMRRPGIAVTYVIFDLLSLDGRSLVNPPYTERRQQLEALNLNGPYWQTPETFEDGHALFEAVSAHMEGVVAKRKERSLPSWREGLGQDQEPKVLAVRRGARVADQLPSRARIRLGSAIAEEAHASL